MANESTKAVPVSDTPQPSLPEPAILSGASGGAPEAQVPPHLSTTTDRDTGDRVLGGVQARRAGGHHPSSLRSAVATRVTAPSHRGRAATAGRCVAATFSTERSAP